MKATSLKAFTLLAALAGPAVAQETTVAPPTAAEATLLQQQAQARLREILGDAVPLPDLIVEFTPEGNGYRITIPIGSVKQVEPKDAVFTIVAHRLDATRWAIDSETLPPTLKVTVQQRVADAAPAQPPISPPTPPATHLVTVTYEWKFGQQTASGVYDPTYATASNTQSTLASIDMVKTGGPAATITHAGTATTISSLTPSVDHRLDVLFDTSVQTYETKTEFVENGPSLTLTIDRLHLISQLSGLATDKLPPLLRLLIDGGMQGSGDAPDPAAKARQREHLHAMLEAAYGLLTGAKVDQTMEGIAFDEGGHHGTIRHAALSFAGDAPQDSLTGSLGLTVDGLTIDDLPPAIVAYVPSHFVIHPTVSNLSVPALTKLGLDASSPVGRAPPDDYAALFLNGGINVGFDQLGLDVAGAALTGTGNFTLTGPQTITGQAEVSARGLDALITQAQANPMLQSAAPILIFLKGIAKTNADLSVWQITVAGGRALVNGVDLMAMFGSMGR